MLLSFPVPLQSKLPELSGIQSDLHCEETWDWVRGIFAREAFALLVDSSKTNVLTTLWEQAVKSQMDF